MTTLPESFRVKKLFPIDIEKARKWFNNLEKNYNDYKFIWGEHSYMYDIPIFGPDSKVYCSEGKAGHLLLSDQWSYNLCFKDPHRRGPIPNEFRKFIKKEWQDDLESDELNPREGFTGYIRDIVDKLAVYGLKTKHWCVSAMPPGAILIQHIDSDDKLRIHIPLYVSEHCYWTVGGEEHKFYLQPGYCYLVNTSIIHSVDNSKGDITRVHVYGKVFVEDCIKKLNLLDALEDESLKNIFSKD
jgi:hypothetical protein